MDENSPSKPEFHDVKNAAATFLRRATIADKVLMMGRLNEMARGIVAQESRAKNPTWSEAQISAEVARRFLADENLPELYASDYFKMYPSSFDCGSDTPNI